MRIMKSLVGLSALLLLIGAKSHDIVVDPGPPPSSLEHFRQLGEAAILQGFFDPESAKFQWDRGIVGGWWKPMFQAKQPGWWTCGLVNGKNRMGGYVGFRRFVVVMRNEQLIFSDTSTGNDFDFLTAQCQQGITKGILPVATSQFVSAAPPSSSPANVLDPKKPYLGFGFTSVPDGAYINMIAPGYPAEQAGLVTGMVIAKINGITIKGFEADTISKLLAATGEAVVLDIIGKGSVELHKAPFQTNK